MTTATDVRTNNVALPYYNYNRILSCNSAYNFVVGGRGLGKTYGAKTQVVRNYLRRSEQFIYLRRYKDELKAARNTFFADFAHEFPGHVFRLNGSEAQIAVAGKDKPKWETMGYFIALSTAQQQKSVAFPRVTRIIFDEFIIEKGNVHYIPGEVNAFNNFYNTVDRYKDKTRVFFLANSVIINNPYFLGFNIKPPAPGEDDIVRLRDGFIAAHFPTAEAFQSKVYQTRFGKFIQGTEYAEYAVGNNFADNHDNLLDEKTSDARYLYTLELGGTESTAQMLSVWRNRDNQYFLQSKRPKEEILFTMFPSKMGEDRVLMLWNDKTLQYLRSAFRHGRMFFDEAKSRNAFLDIMNKR